MNNAYLVAENIITSLGFTLEENIDSILAGKIGIMPASSFSVKYPSPLLSLVDTDTLDRRFGEVLDLRQPGRPAGSFTRLEKLFICSIHDALLRTGLNVRNNRVLLVISTTKGNISLLEERFKARFNHKRVFLWEMTRVIGEFFGFMTTPIIVSNACISGVLALSVASRRIRSGQYDHAVVAGGDLISEFVLSGFHSFQAISPEPCRPYDIKRNGLSLGEAAGTIILSNNTPEGVAVRIAGSATTNDANHISGPSRTGRELSLAIDYSLAEAGLGPGEIGYISAHGTATPFNDEMESKAVSLSKLNEVPLNSFKGYWGHTLGAAGVIESAAAVHSLRNNLLLRSAGFDEPGVPEKINVIGENLHAELNTCLKTASGFGGCNAAMIFEKC